MLGVAVRVLLGVAVRHSWLRAWWVLLCVLAASGGPAAPLVGGGLLGSCCLGLCVLRVWCGRRLLFGVWCALVGLVSVAVVGVCVVCTLGRVCGVLVVRLGACPRLCGRGLAALFGVGAVCRAPPPVSAVWFPAPLGWGLLVVRPLAVPFACPPPSVSFPCRLGRCRVRAFPAVVCGGGSLSPARVPSPGVSPWGGRCLHSPSGCNSVVRMPSMDLFRSQVLQPFPTPGSGTLWVAGESLRDRRVSCLPRWTVCPTRSPSLGPNRSTCRGECSWSGPLVTPPGRCHRGPLTNLTLTLTLTLTRKTKTVAIRVGDGRTIHSLGGVDVTIYLGDETVTQHCRVLDTDAFHIVIGTDFLRRNPQVKMLSLQRPYSLDCDFGSGLFSVPLELSGRKESGLRYAAKTNYRTENYQLARHVLENGLAALQVNLDEIQVELFASQQQHIMQLYCSKQMNNAFRFFWKAMGLAYANPPFSLLAKVLTKIAYEGGRVVMCTPDPGCSGEHAYWRRMLDRMTVGRVQLPDGPIYVPEDSDTAMQAPEWASFLSIIDGSLNPVPLCDLDQVLLKEVMAEYRGLTLYDLKNRSPEHLSATLTGFESPDDYLEPAAVKEDADDQLSEIASTIPSVDPSCVDLKHSAFLAQLLLEEVDLESTSEPASSVGKPVLHMQPVHTGEPVARSADALARPAANNMPLSEHDTQELRRLLYLKAEGIERQERLQYLRQTWKYSIWSEEDDESYTLPDPEIPLVYSLHYGQQCSPEWDDGTVPAKTADRHKKKEHGKSNLHAEEDFLQKLESLNLDPRLKKLLMTYEEVFGALPPPLSCKKLVQMDLKLKPEFEKTRVRRRPYPAPQEQVEEIERQIQECIDAGLVEEYKHGDYPHHCSPCFLVAKPGSTALRLVVDYGEVNM